MDSARRGEHHKKDKAVDVYFDPTAPDPDASWTFIPSDVKMHCSGHINFEKDPHNQPWTFAGAQVKDDTHKQFHTRVRDGKLQIENHHKSKGTWEYTISVNYNGKVYQSPDPKITNTDPDGEP